MDTEKTSSKRDNTLALLGLVILSVCTIWYFTIPFLTWLWPPANQNQGNQIADMYGATNTLFSGLAFAFLIANTYMQSKQLKTQQEELKLTRSEITEQRKQMEQQSFIFESQTADSIFFKLLDSLQHQSKIIESHREECGENNDGEYEEWIRKESGIEAFYLIRSCVQYAISSRARKSELDADNFLNDLKAGIYRSTSNFEQLNTYYLIFSKLIELSEKNQEKHLSLLNALMCDGERFVMLVFLFLREKYKTIELLNNNNFYHDLQGYHDFFHRVICIKSGRPDPGVSLPTSKTIINW